MTEAQPLQPVLALPLIAETRKELLRVLEGLDDSAWPLPTACEEWSVRDVALHILGDDIGHLSNLRDKDGEFHEVEDWDGLVRIINAQNDLWVRATRRISRRLLVDLLQITGEQVFEVFETVDPDEQIGPIGWAGDGPDPRWLHIAREFTEYWMHHQHICEAAGIVSLKEARYMQPLLSTFVRSLPVAYQNVDAALGTAVKVVFTGVGGSEWHVIKEKAGWTLAADTAQEPLATVAMNVDIAWRFFTRNRPVHDMLLHIHIDGDTELGRVFLKARAFIG